MSAKLTVFEPFGSAALRARTNLPESLSLRQIWYDARSLLSFSPVPHVRNRSAKQSPSRSMYALECGEGNGQSKPSRSSGGVELEWVEGGSAWTDLPLARPASNTYRLNRLACSVFAQTFSHRTGVFVSPAL
jgi:hypothetical protein